MLNEGGMVAIYIKQFGIFDFAILKAPNIQKTVGFFENPNVTG